MATIGYALSSEEHDAPELVRLAARAERAGFGSLWISDHFHPWNDEQGESPFVWGTLGAISQVTERIPVTTAVTCPTIRIHPAVTAQAAATAATLLPGRFALGVGSGEALNEHILGTAWPSADVRLRMLEEAVEVIRKLWSGETVSHEGRHYTVVNARIYSLPEQPPPILMSAFGHKSAELAGRIADGLCGVMPDADLLGVFAQSGGAGKPTQGGLKVCWGEDEAAARKTAHRLWASEQLPGQLGQELPTPQHFEQASTLVTEDQVASSVVCGSEVERHVAAIQRYVDAGYDQINVGQIGPEQDGFFEFYADHVLPRFGQG